MSQTILTNDCSTTLAAPIDNAQTSLVVLDGSAFPAGGNFHIRIDSEVMLVTSIMGNTWTVTRAYEPINGVQAASAHAAGVDVFGVFTIAAATSGATPGSYTNPVMTVDNYGRTSAIANGTNRFFSGTGMPSAGLGLVGDYYIDIATSIVYLKS